MAPTPTIFVLYATPKKETFLLGWPYEKVTFGQRPEPWKGDSSRVAFNVLVLDTGRRHLRTTVKTLEGWMKGGDLSLMFEIRKGHLRAKA